MNKEQEHPLFTVEYECSLGVVYYRNVVASDFEQAKTYIHQQQPDVIIRAVTMMEDEA
ncbi:hypothetical protein [Chengkuizengella axinellae]|uniref:Uncharacterized protein n=1 Tax=Chengkuizengella axinellae TaxID=3064388 RepID=A0ABT9IVZ3_9BACL|nr:hypothetical protein [Chengkuizengella sp. 2205SS18-9]MDP5273535.1 hypothetical protein [Chengkuizengella sp. 2205SS18-9]